MPENSQAQARWPVAETPTPDLVLKPFAPEETYKTKAYNALKRAIINMDIYSSSEPAWIDERQLSERLGVSRTPVREAIAMLEQQGFVKSVPRRGIMVVKKTKREVIEMIQVWAALEGMAARLVTQRASDAEIARLRALYNESHKPEDHLSEYATANIRFHQTIIELTGSKLLAEMTESLLLHVRGIRQITIGREDLARRSIQDHLKIIEAIEKRDTELAEKLARDHTLGLAAYVDEHGEGIFD
ncbi:GntR family transcriptional regulator [Hyphomicrobium sp.]|uniref:GntR family transcriptional regulator n=1 Tax=Hyphomicrobium sp. TaxID=82 RepID=UPI0025B7FC37|nr:GntR family transcriptional regulator [Hyphomicrobium sp.]